MNPDDGKEKEERPAADKAPRRERPEASSRGFGAFPYRGRDKEPLENLALSDRPFMSIRTRLVFAFSLIFALCVIITIWSIYAVSLLDEKIHFLETSGNYRTEIQQARRFEKNYLLYGTNLEDALEHLADARRILTQNGDTVEKVLGRRAASIMAEHLAEYHRLLAALAASKDPAERRILETKLRDHGAQMVNLASDFEKVERENVRMMLSYARRIPFLFLGVLLITSLFVAYFLARQILISLSRFREYANRIGQGDFTPITPQKKYQDEFSLLAMAFNRMIHELDRRHTILVESHKLRAVGTLVAGVAHELNNPLNNTMLTASMLEEDFADMDDDQKREMIADIIRETERSQKIVRHLLDFARESEIRVEPLSMNRILTDSIRLVANQVKIAKISLTTDFTENLPPVHGDLRMLQQVFINLILNAVDALPQKGSIRITTAPAGQEGYILVEVSDNGPGIPEHILPRIFEPFFTTKAPGKGTGLGLSVSRGIVRKLGGYLSVKSTQGEGTTFSVLLPATGVPSDISSG